MLARREIHFPGALPDGEEPRSIALRVVEIVIGVEAAARDLEEIAAPLSEVEAAQEEEVKVSPGAEEPGEEADLLTVGPDEERVAEEHRPPLPPKASARR